MARGVLNAFLAFVLAFTSLGFASKAFAATTVRVPNITGYTLQEAVNDLTASNLNWQVAEGCSNYKDAKVTDMDPYGGSVVEQGSMVTLWTKEQETVIDEMRLGYYQAVPQGDGSTKQELIQFPDADQGWVPWIQEKNGAVQLALSVKWRGQSFVLSSEPNSGMSNSDIQWGSSDNSIATVDRGLVKATGAKDGDVTITCTLINTKYTPSAASGAIKAQIVVRVIGQEGAYPIAMAITDENGTPQGDNPIVFEEADGTSEHQAYVMVKYSDGSYKCNARYCNPSYYSKDIPGLTWRTGNEKIAVVGETTGLVSPAKDGAGTTELVATVTGGKAGNLTDTVYVTIKGLGAVQPASTLTVNVVYDQDRSNIVSSKVYNTSTLAQASANKAFVRSAYSQIKAGGGFRTVSAEGVYLDDLMADLGVKDTENIYGLILKANDGVNNGFVAGPALFQKANYYFPNFDAVSSTGVHNTSGGVRVYPMVAVRSYVANESTDVDFGKMNGNYCFELCLGNNGGTLDDTTARYSIHWMYEMTVVMQGAPKQNLGDNMIGGNTGTGGDGTQGDDNDGNGNGGTGDKDDTQGGDEGDSKNDGSNVVLGIGGERSDQPLNSAAQDSGASASEANESVLEQEDQIEKTEEEIPDEPTPEEDPQEQAEKRWQVFQMMSNSKDDFDLDFNNPLEPFMVPAALGVAAVSGTRTVVRQRKEQGRPITIGRKDD